MISIKKYLDRNPEELLRATLESYRCALDAMGNSGSQACPSLGVHLQESLANLQAHISTESSPSGVRETGDQVRKELHEWGEQAAGYYQQKTCEVKEILIVLARTAEEIAKRDRRYGGHLGELTGHLEAMAGLDDLAEIRSSLVRSAGELRQTVTEMARESQSSVQELRAELTAYQSRLEEADRRACVDELTGLQNRRGVEAELARSVERRTPFTVILLDLNGFKLVNDQHGHLAGDVLLKQFGTELRSAVRSTDVVGRWGGDEFVVLVDGAAAASQDYIERIHKWVFGDYSVPHQNESAKVKVHVTASIGAATWRPGEDVTAVFSRADATMYKDKANQRKTAPASTLKR